MTTKTSLTLDELKDLKKEWWRKAPSLGVIQDIAITLGEQNESGTYNYNDALRGIQIYAKVDTPEQGVVRIGDEQVYNYQWQLFKPDKVGDLFAKLGKSAKTQKETDKTDKAEKERLDLIKELGLEDES